MTRNKELEALKGIKQAIAEHLHKQTGVSVEKHFEYLQNDTEISIVEQALTPPTADEVCKALGEYLGYEVEAWNEYGKMCFKSVYTSPFQKISKNYTTIIWLYGNAVAFEDGLRLPPHLTTMIGKFYESLEGEKWEKE